MKKQKELLDGELNPGPRRTVVTDKPISSPLDYRGLMVLKQSKVDMKLGDDPHLGLTQWRLAATVVWSGTTSLEILLRWQIMQRLIAGLCVLSSNVLAF